MSALIGKAGDKIEGLEETTEVFGNRWSALLQNWIPVLSDHISSISKLTTDVTELQSSAKIPDPYDILNSFNPRSKVTSTRTKSFASDEHVNKLKNDIQGTFSWFNYKGESYTTESIKINSSIPSS